MYYIFIVNPKSRTGQGELLWSQLEPELKKRRVSYEVRMTGRKKDAERIATEITADEEEHTMIVLGGDGSLNEVINGIKNPSKVTLGYIPTGSSNDFARGMGIPKDAKKALELILNSEKIEKLDVGELVLGGKRRRFLVSAGMGFDAAVCHEVCISKWKKILNRLKLGKLSYAVVALNRLLKDQPVRMEIRLDDGSVHRFECAYFAAFMNQKYEGGGFKFCPEASPSDGKLDIMVAADLSKKKILCLLPTAFFGKHTKFRGVTILQCRSAEVSTGSTLPIHTDGEPIFLRNEMKVRLMEEKIRFITE